MKNFKSFTDKPVLAFRPWAIWIWNYSCTVAEALKQLDGFVEKGFGGVAIRPSRDMSPQFLSAEFFDIFGQVLARAKEKNIGVKLVEDLSLPWSGALTSDLQAKTELRLSKMEMVHSEAIVGKSEFKYTLEAPEDSMVFIAKYKNERIDLTSVKRISVPANNSQVVYKTQGGNWLFVVLRKSTLIDPVSGYVPNLFNAQTAPLYIDRVLSQIKSRFSKFCGFPFSGLVTELPHCCIDEHSIIWDDDLAVKFRTKYKKELSHFILGLFFQVTDTSARLKCQAYDYLATSAVERFAAPIEAWLKKFGMTQWTLFPEATAYRNSSLSKESIVMPSGKLAAIGYGNQDGVEANYPILKSLAFNNAVVQQSETCVVLGRNRKGIGASVQSLKTEIDLAITLGRSNILIDGCFFNLEQRGSIKTPINPSWYSSQWSAMAPLTAYSGRMQTIIDGVWFNRQIAVLDPSVSRCADHGRTILIDEAQAQLSLVAIGAELSRNNFDYDVISESALGSCSVRSASEFGAVLHGKRLSFSALIIPNVKLLQRDVLTSLEKLAAKGIKIVFCVEPPIGCVEDGVTSTAEKRFERLVKNGKNVSVKPLAKIVETLGESASPIRAISGQKQVQEIVFMHGASPKGDLYTIHNSTAVEQFVQIELKDRKRHLYILDAVHGEAQEIDNITKTAGIASFPLLVHPRQTAILFESSIKVSPIAKKSKGINFSRTARSYRIVLKDQWTLSSDSLNVLPFASWNSRIGLSRESGGYSHFYESFFDVKTLPEVCFLDLNGLYDRLPAWVTTDNNIEVSLNATRIDATTIYKPVVSTTVPPAPEATATAQLLAATPFLRPGTVHNVKDAIHRGINRISIRSIGGVLDPHLVVYPPLLAGNFMVVKGPKGYVLDKGNPVCGYSSWTTSGFPYLSGTGIYRQTFEVPANHKAIVLRFSQATGPISVMVNGKSVGNCDWQPMEMDITSAVTSKTNEVSVRVLNTTDNVIKLNGRASGLLGEAYLDIYQ